MTNLFSVVLQHRAGLEGLHQIPQVVGLGLELPPDVRLGDFQAALHPLEHLGAVGNVLVLLDGLLPAAEGLVGDDTHDPGVVDEGVPGDAGGGLIGPAEAAVDDQQLAVWQWGPSRPNSFKRASHTAGSW